MPIAKFSFLSLTNATTKTKIEMGVKDKLRTRNLTGQIHQNGVNSISTLGFKRAKPQGNVVREGNQVRAFRDILRSHQSKATGVSTWSYCHCLVNETPFSPHPFDKIRWVGHQPPRMARGGRGRGSGAG